MIHHDHRNYQEAASAAAANGRVKMEEIIHSGLRSAEAVIQKVQNATVTDSIVRSGAVSILPRTGQAGWNLMAKGDTIRPLHEHAFGQVLEKANVSGFGRKFVDDLAKEGEWGRELVAHNLNTIYAHGTERHLVRRSENQVMAFLSDRYRRLDSRPLLDAFMGACTAMSLVPIQGHALDTKVRLRAVLPKVFEPLPNEVMLFGLEWGNSDFGDGGHCVNLWVMRVWCTNLAIGEQCLRQVHLGKRLDDNIAYSQATLESDTKTNMLALRDVVKHHIGPDRVNAYLTVIKEAAEEEVQSKDVATILKKHLDKATIDKATEMFNSPDVLNLPAGNSMYRLSNALSFLAQAKDIRPERQLELQKVAGDLLPKMKVKAREV